MFARPIFVLRLRAQEKGSEILGSYGGTYEYYCPVGYDVVKLYGLFKDSYGTNYHN
jgi:hypothetical protein